MSEMEELSIEQCLELWPDLKQFMDYDLFITIKEFEKIKVGDTLIIDDKLIYVEFIKNILSNSLYFEYASRLFRGDIDCFSVTYIIYGDTGEKIGSNCTKPIIIKAIDELVKEGKITLTGVEKERYDYLNSFTSYDLYKEKVKNNKFEIKMDEKDYSIPVSEIIKFMELSKEEYEIVCQKDTYNDIPIEYFAYAVRKYISSNKILENINTPDIYRDRYKSLTDYTNIDSQAVNKFLTTTDTIYEQVLLDSDFELAILDGMPEDATDLEKAIYIYIKMCLVLTYDEEYFAAGQKGEAAKKHRDVSHISKITPEDNGAVCFEFNAIYSKFLNDLGINFASTYKEYDGEVYGGPHVWLNFRVGKHLVYADVVTTILEKDDMLNAKLGNPLIGIKTRNKNTRTQIEFDKALKKMYNLIKKQTEPVDRPTDLADILKEYSLVTENLSEISFDDRLSIMITKANSSKMKGTDTFGYLIKLRSALFNDTQKRENLKVSVLGNNYPLDESKDAMGLAVISINPNSFNGDPGSTKYYLYVPNQDYLEDIPLEELQFRFDKGAYEYIDKEDPRIPGVVNGGYKIDSRS